MDSRLILNYALHSELMNFIDMFGDSQKFLLRKYLPIADSVLEFKFLLPCLTEMQKRDPEFVADVGACMNKFIEPEQFLKIYPRLSVSFQQKCLQYQDIYIYLYNIVHRRESRSGLYHFSTRAHSLHLQLILDLYHQTEKLKTYIYIHSNNKVRVYTNNQIIIKYYKILDKLLDDGLPNLLDSLKNYHECMRVSLFNIDFHLAEKLCAIMCRSADRVFCHFLLLFSCVESDCLHIQKEDIFIRPRPQQFKPEILSLLDKNNFLI